MITSRLSAYAKNKYSSLLQSIVDEYRMGLDGETAMRILDVGAGNCWLLNLLPPEHTRVGVDISANLHFIEGTSAAFLEARSSHFVFGDATRLPFPDRTFDFVYSNEVVSHVKDIDAMFREKLRVLKPGGIVVAMDVNVLNPVTFLDLLVGNYLRSRKSKVRHGGMKWLFHRYEPFFDGSPDTSGGIMAGWKEENCHGTRWWRKKLRPYSNMVNFEVSTFWSYLPISFAGLIANKIIIMGKKL